MVREAAGSPEGVLHADPEALRAFASACETAATDLDAVTTRATSTAVRLSGPAGCGELFRDLCDALGRQATGKLSHGAEGLRAHGQALRLAAAQLAAADADSAGAIERAVRDTNQ